MESRQSSNHLSADVVMELAIEAVRIMDAAHNPDKTLKALRKALGDAAQKIDVEPDEIRRLFDENLDKKRKEEIMKNFDNLLKTIKEEVAEMQKREETFRTEAIDLLNRVAAKLYPLTKVFTDQQVVTSNGDNFETIGCRKYSLDESATEFGQEKIPMFYMNDDGDDSIGGPVYFMSDDNLAILLEDLPVVIKNFISTHKNILTGNKKSLEEVKTTLASLGLNMEKAEDEFITCPFCEELTDIRKGDTLIGTIKQVSLTRCGHGAIILNGTEVCNLVINNEGMLLVPYKKLFKLS